MPERAVCALRVPLDEYLGLALRAHALLRDVPLHDVSAVDLPGGGAGRGIVDVRALTGAASSSRLVTLLFAFRRLLGSVFGWDRKPLRPEESLLPRLSERDRRESEVSPGTRVGAFLLLYQFPREMLLETRNRTVHGWVCAALAPAADGHRLYVGVYVRPVSWLTRPYLLAIEPFRRILYPLVLRGLRRAWIAAGRER